MRLTIDSASLRAAVDWAARHTPARPAAPILAAAILDATAAGLTVSGFDYDTWGEQHLDAAVTETGRLAVPGRLLRSVADAMARNQRVDLVADPAGSGLRVECGELRASLPLMPVEDYPSRPAIPAAGIELPADLGRVLAAAAPIAADLEDTVPQSCGCELVLAAAGLTVAAIDRYRLFTSRLPWPAASTGKTANRRLPLAASTVRALAETLKGAKQAHLGLPDDGQHVAAVTADGRTLGVRLSGNQPTAWDKLVAPVEPARSVVVDAAELADLIKRLLPVTEVLKETKARHLDVEVTAGLLRLTATAEARLADAIPAEHLEQWDTDPWPLRINGPFLVGLLEAADAERVRIDLAGPTKAWRLIRPGSDLFTGVFMPVRIPEGAGR